MKKIRAGHTKLQHELACEDRVENTVALLNDTNLLYKIENDRR